ncbi:hypothetical protein [Streptomyces sp. NBRC 109706]|uniref:hypothetical protein n=1 Tax=Streptomyces sp. NBRC 109706 TaxID=1550035 RepID=UPI00078344EB|nr:hypothetical protein [Streptomyces sp. NBRC 109706]
MPASYLGEWTGNATMNGMPIGTVTVDLSEGRIDEVVGTVAAADAIGLSLCVDELTLRAVAEGQLTFQAELDASRSNLSAACHSEPYDFVLRPVADGQLAFNGYAEDNSYEGVADRRG